MLRRHCRLRGESMESRCCLDGTVIASAIAGAALLRGDENSNSVSLVFTPSDGTPLGTNLINIEITPDATTRINNQAPGTPFTLRNVSRSLHLDLNGGNDKVTVDGANLPLSRLRVSTGTGNDEITLQHLSITQLLSATSSSGADRLLVDRSIARSTQIDNLSNDAMQATLTNVTTGLVNAPPSSIGLITKAVDLSSDGLTVHGTASLQSRARGTNVLNNLDVSQQLQINGTTSSLTLQHAHASATYVKFDGIDAASSLHLSDVRTTNALDIRVATGDVDGDGLSADRAIIAATSAPNGPHVGKVSLQDFHFRSQLVVGGSLDALDLQHGSAVGLFVKFRTTPTSAKVALSDLSITKRLDVQIPAGDVSGDGIVAESASLVSYGPSTGAVGGKVQLQDFHFRQLDKSTPKLARLAVTGSFREADLQHGEAESVHIQFDGVDAESIVALQDVTVAEDASVEFHKGDFTAVGLRTADTHIKFATSGKVSMQDFHFTKQVDKTSPVLGRLIVSGATGAVDLQNGEAESVHIKFDGVDAESIVALQDVTVAEDASVEFHKGDFTAVGLRTADTHIKFATSGKVSMQDFHFTKQVDKTSPVLGRLIVSGATGAVDLQDGEAESVHIKFDGVDAESIVALQDVTVAEDARVEFHKGDFTAVGLRTADTHIKFATSGKVSMQDFHFTKQVDKASPVLGRLIVSGATGAVDLQDGEAESVHIKFDGVDAESIVALQDVNVAEDASVEFHKGDFTAVGLRTADTHIKFATSGKVSMQDFHFTKQADKASPVLGRLIVSGATGAVDLQDGEAESVHIQFDGVDAESIVALQDVTVAEDARVEFHNGDFTAVRLRTADTHIKFATSGKVSMQDFHFTKQADKTSPLLGRLIVTGATGTVDLQDGEAESVHIQFDGVDAESIVALQDVTVAEDASVEFHNGDFTAVGLRTADTHIKFATSGKVSMQDFHFTKQADKTSPLLGRLIVTGASGDVDLQHGEVDAAYIKFDGPEGDRHLTFNDIHTPGDLIVEATANGVGANGVIGGATRVDVAHVDVGGLLDLLSEQTTSSRVSLDEATLADLRVRMRLTTSPVSAAINTVLLRSVNVLGSTTIEQTHASTSSGRMLLDMTDVHLGDADFSQARQGELKGHVVLIRRSDTPSTAARVVLDHQMSDKLGEAQAITIEGVETGDLSVTGAVHNLAPNRMSVNVSRASTSRSTSIDTEADATDIALEGLTALQLTVTTHGGGSAAAGIAAHHVRIAHSDILGRMAIRGPVNLPGTPISSTSYELDNVLVKSIASLRAGSGDDRVVVTDSIFESLANFYGGDGIDSLTAQGNLFTKTPFVLEFESTSMNG